MFGWILVYMSGAVTGVALMVWNKKSVEKALVAEKRRHDAEVQRLRQQVANLRADSDCEQRTRDCADAFRRGFQKGRSDPMTDAEKFAKSWEGRNVQFRATSGKQSA